MVHLRRGRPTRGLAFGGKLGQNLRIQRVGLRTAREGAGKIVRLGRIHDGDAKTGLMKADGKAYPIEPVASSTTKVAVGAMPVLRKRS